MTFDEQLESLEPKRPFQGHLFSMADYPYPSAFLWLDHVYDWVLAERWMDPPSHRAACTAIIELWSEAKCQGIGDPLP
jgi:hypothetical protein